MKRLDQITINEWIDVLTGDTSPLVAAGEQPTEQELTEHVAALCEEYKRIATPVTARRDLNLAEDRVKLEMKADCLRLCRFLCSAGEHERVRDILRELGVNVARLTTDEKVESEVRGLLNMADYDLKRARAEMKSLPKVDIRASMGEEIATLMTLFRMSIDPNTMSAAIYAHLVKQGIERVKQLKKAAQKTT